MTIKAISTTELHDECNGCGMQNVLAVEELLAGLPNAPDMIALPPCGTCGAITALQGEPYNTPENRQHLYDTEQHGAINALYAVLATAGRLHSDMSQVDLSRISTGRIEPPKRMIEIGSSFVLIRSEAEEFPEMEASGGGSRLEAVR